jgi:hypothetical protein
MEKTIMWSWKDKEKTPEEKKFEAEVFQAFDALNAAAETSFRIDDAICVLKQVKKHAEDRLKSESTNVALQAGLRYAAIALDNAYLAKEYFGFLKNS